MRGEVDAVLHATRRGSYWFLTVGPSGGATVEWRANRHDQDSAVVATLVVAGSIREWTSTYEGLPHHVPRNIGLAVRVLWTHLMLYGQPVAGSPVVVVDTTGHVLDDDDASLITDQEVVLLLTALEELGAVQASTAYDAAQLAYRKRWRWRVDTVGAAVVISLRDPNDVERLALRWLKQPLKQPRRRRGPTPPPLARPVGMYTGTRRTATGAVETTAAGTRADATVVAALVAKEAGNARTAMGATGAVLLVCTGPDDLHRVTASDWQVVPAATQLPDDVALIVHAIAAVGKAVRVG